MNRIEFGVTMNNLREATGKELSSAALEVYFDCLGDLDASVFRIASQRVLMDHPWATFPSIAELRQAAVDTLRGEVKELSPGEAWELAWRAARNIDPEVQSSIDRARKELPPLVWEAINSLSLLDLCYGKEPVGVIRGQFMRIYEGIAARERRKALLPKATLDALDDIRERRAIPGNSPVAGMLAGIGKNVEA